MSRVDWSAQWRSSTTSSSGARCARPPRAGRGRPRRGRPRSRADSSALRAGRASGGPAAAGPSAGCARRRLGHASGDRRRRAGRSPRRRAGRAARCRRSRGSGRRTPASPAACRDVAQRLSSRVLPTPASPASSTLACAGAAAAGRRAGSTARPARRLGRSAGRPRGAPRPHDPAVTGLTSSRRTGSPARRRPRPGVARRAVCPTPSRIRVAAVGDLRVVPGVPSLVHLWLLISSMSRDSSSEVAPHIGQTALSLRL